MIRTFAKREGKRFCLYVSGHAEKTKEGERVCAAVSVLIAMLIRHAHGAGDCRHVRALQTSGSCSLSCTGDIGEIFEMVVRTFDELAVDYPTHMARVSYVGDKGEEIT